MYKNSSLKQLNKAARVVDLILILPFINISATSALVYSYIQCPSTRVDEIPWFYIPDGTTVVGSLQMQPRMLAEV
jgi:hypothetical protein